MVWAAITPKQIPSATSRGRCSPRRTSTSLPMLFKAAPSWHQRCNPLSNMDGQRLAGLVERVLQLKTVPLFAEASPDEAVVIAERVTERWLAPGEALFSVG